MINDCFSFVGNCIFLCCETWEDFLKNNISHNSSRRFTDDYHQLMGGFIILVDNGEQSDYKQSPEIVFRLIMRERVREYSLFFFTKFNLNL